MEASSEELPIHGNVVAHDVKCKIGGQVSHVLEQAVVVPSQFKLEHLCNYIMGTDKSSFGRTKSRSRRIPQAIRLRCIRRFSVSASG